MPTKRFQICSLRLVYPPISNQEAEWLKDDPAVQEELRHSNFYMIGSRAEAKFENFSFDKDRGIVEFEFTTGDGINDPAFIDFGTLPGVTNLPAEYSEIEIGDKFVRIWATDEQKNRLDQVLDWFTTEKLLFDRWQRKPGLGGLAQLRALTTYELLYAGISTKEDAFARLLKKPHDKRLRILANEPQKAKGARVTDETFLFFFRIEPLRIHTFDIDSDFSDEDLQPDLQVSRIVADAEKAYVRFVESRYNTVKYKNYPKGRDGLYETGLDRYCYVIGEDLTFHGPGATIVGAYEPDLPVSNDADAIFVEGEETVLFKAEEVRALSRALAEGTEC